MEERGFKKLPKDNKGVRFQGVTLEHHLLELLQFSESEAGRLKGDAVMLVTQFLVSSEAYRKKQKVSETASFTSLRHQIEECITIFSKKHGIINSNQITSFVKENIKPLYSDQKEEDLCEMVSRILCITKTEEDTKKQEEEAHNNLRHPASPSVTKNPNPETDFSDVQVGGDDL